MQAGVVKLSQHDALMVEVLRANGISDEELLAQLKKGDVSPYVGIGGGDFDFTDLLAFAKENADTLEQAMRHGYAIKFSTFNGTRYMLRVKFGKLTDRDYVSGPDYIDRLKLNDSEFRTLSGMLSSNWRITELDGSGPQERVVRVSLSAQA